MRLQFFIQSQRTKSGLGSPIQRSWLLSRQARSNDPPPDWRNGLPPPTRTDSFVKEAKHHANHIYGDEGTRGLPPYMGFSKVHRINTGIMDERDRRI